MAMLSIDLNCDMGEGFGVYEMGADEEIMQQISSANIACGFHAGDPVIMRRTVDLAIKNKVAIGAHPGFPDLLGFGRRKMDLSTQEIYEIVIYQVGALLGFVQAAGARLHHVKPHGALYTKAATDKALAQAIAKAVYDIDPALILYGLAGSELIKAGIDIGLVVANEVFADRTYQNDGTLTPHTQPNCLIVSIGAAVRQVIRMVREQKVKTLQGQDIPIIADTVCIHGDRANALSFARKIKKSLEQAGVEVVAV